MPFLRTLGGAESTMAGHMKGGAPRVLVQQGCVARQAREGLDEIRMQDQDTKGDVYEYLLSQITNAG